RNRPRVVNMEAMSLSFCPASFSGVTSNIFLLNDIFNNIIREQMKSAKKVLTAILLLATGLVGCSESQQQQANDTEKYPMVASTNVWGLKYPKVNEDLSVTFWVDAPEAQKVQVEVPPAGTTYDMNQEEDGSWTVTTDPQV